MKAFSNRNEVLCLLSILSWNRPFIKHWTHPPGIAIRLSSSIKIHDTSIFVVIPSRTIHKAKLSWSWSTQFQISIKLNRSIGRLWKFRKAEHLKRVQHEDEHNISRYVQSEISQSLLLIRISWKYDDLRDFGTDIEVTIWYFICYRTFIFAAGIIAILDEPMPELKVFALKKLDSIVDEFWPEISESIEKM